MEQTRECKHCKGTGQTDDIMYTIDPIKYPNIKKTCSRCNGSGKFTAPDFKAILAALTVKRKGKVTFRASKPKGSHSDPNYNRVYYTWRLARFHGGVDVTLPMTATLFIEGDPFEPELDAAANQIARHVFGTDRAAAYRWGHALGAVNNVPDGLPASAYPGGPVVMDDNKPFEEKIELGEDKDN